MTLYRFRLANLIISIASASTLLILTTSCSSEQPLPQRPELWPYWGDARAQINSESWDAEPFADFDPENRELELVMALYNDFYIQKENLYIACFTDSLGKQKVFRRQDGIKRPFCMFFYVDSDVTRAWYEIGEGDTSSFVTLDYFNKTTGELSGSFSLDLVLAGNPSNMDAPESLTIREGFFHTRLLE